ncbi:MAG TPA: TolC family protein [Bryobacteraceae bacterium]|nr:TolC family protein [Bryobacteraceae bacterium]
MRWALFFATCIGLAAQQLTLEQAVEAASKSYPSIRVSQEQMNAVAEGIRLARTAYLPRVDALAQENRATRNNVFGMLLPQNVIPSMSGPVLGTNNSGTAWGSTLGVLASWEPFDFGLRQANVATAEAAKTQAEAAVKRTRFEVASATVDSYLTLAAAEELVRAAQAGVDRAETVLRTTEALTTSQLRPGADFSRAQAEFAAARTQWIQARQAVDVARATLAQFVGLPPGQVAISTPALLRMPSSQDALAPEVSGNPAVAEQNATVEQARAQLRALERSYFPKFSLQASVYARGTGAETSGALLGGLNGMAPTYANFALGFTVTFPIMDLVSIRAKEAAQSAAIRAQGARTDQIVTELKAHWNIAQAQLRGARATAENTPLQVAAARTALDQASARYQSGLGTIDQVADAQRLLTRAEIDDALARLTVWRALSGLAMAAGDLRPFIAEAGR